MEVKVAAQLNRLQKQKGSNRGTSRYRCAMNDRTEECPEILADNCRSCRWLNPCSDLSHSRVKSVLLFRSRFPLQAFFEQGTTLCWSRAVVRYCRCVVLVTALGRDVLCCLGRRKGRQINGRSRPRLWEYQSRPMYCAIHTGTFSLLYLLHIRCHASKKHRNNTAKLSAQVLWTKLMSATYICIASCT